MLVDLEQLGWMIGGKMNFYSRFVFLKRKSISENNAVLWRALRRLAKWSCLSFQQAVQLLL